MAGKEEKNHAQHKHTELAIGGQAVIEGVMMKTKDRYAIAVRKENGKIVIKKDKDSSITSNHKILGLPFIRGIILLVETTILGMKALTYSANQIDISEEKDKTGKAEKEKNKNNDKNEKKGKKDNISTSEILITFGISLVFALLLFKFLPLLAANFLSKLIGGGNLVFNLIDVIIKLAIFIAYLALIGLAPDVKRLFQYHGAEHKTVRCYEHKKPLTVENVKKEMKAHPRCGTSFLLFVLIISMLFYLLIPLSASFIVKLAARIILLPIIAGISYEIIKLASKHQDNIIIKILIFPSLLVQGLTTREPDNKQIEVAIASLKAVI